MERLKNDASFSRKRALSSSPYPDLLDVSSMIRYSPSSLYASKNSIASGSFGHLGATALNAASTSATNASIGTPMSISSLPTSLQHFLISGELLPTLSGHYISPTNSMFSLAHHQAMASSLMQIDASMQSLKSVSSFNEYFRIFLITKTFLRNHSSNNRIKNPTHQIQKARIEKPRVILRL